jgi:integrase
MPRKRRGSGEGSIYQRASDGRWVSSVELGHIGGKRRRRTIYGRTRKEVAEKLKALHADQEAGTLRAVDKTTLGAFLLDWIETAHLTRRASTVDNQRRVITKHIIPAIGHLRRDRVNADDINALMAVLVKQDKAATAKLARQVLHTAYAEAVKQGKVRFNPVESTSIPKYEVRMPHSLSEAEAQRLLAVLEGERFGIAVKLGQLLGLRRGEISGARWSDIDWHAKTISIRRTAGRTGKTRYTNPPKSKAGVRTLPLVAGLDDDLAAHRIAQADEFRLKGIENTGDLIVASQAATQYDTANYLTAFRQLLAKADLPLDIRPHDLRHTTAILLIQRGVDPRTVAQILGHASTRITMDIYTRSQQSDTAAAIEGLGQRIGKKRKD